MRWREFLAWGALPEHPDGVEVRRARSTRSRRVQLLDAADLVGGEPAEQDDPGERNDLGVGEDQVLRGRGVADVGRLRARAPLERIDHPELDVLERQKRP